jgi:hypothetical protein
LFSSSNFSNLRLWPRSILFYIFIVSSSLHNINNIYI